MSKKIVMLSGSPRKGGNTDTLSAAFIEGAESAGKTVTLFRTAEMKLGGCLGCGHCFETQGICVQKDDMTQILDALRSADALVLASPIYFFGVTAQLKLAIDRTFALLRAKTSIARAALLLTCGNGGIPATEGAVSMYNKMCAFSKWDSAGVVIIPGLQKPDDIRGRDELDKARALGREI